jgi:hypothetical protein
MDLREIMQEGVGCIYGSRQGPAAGYCEYSNKLPVSIIGR